MASSIFPLVLGGTLLGLFIGTIPGMHMNLISIILINLLGGSFILNSHLSIFLIAAASAHTFSSIIPAIFLSAPEEGTALSVLPAHRLFQRGFGFEAVRITLLGCFSGLVLTLILSPLIIRILPHLYQLVRPNTLILLIIMTLFLIMREHGLGRTFFLSIFLLSGTLGLISMNTPIEQALFPLLTGMFGASTILWNLTNPNEEKKKQCNKKIFNVDIRDLIFTSKISVVSGLCAVLLPGIGKTQCGLLAMRLLGRRDLVKQLIAIGTLHASGMLLALISLFAINRPRDGTVVMISNLIKINQSMLVVLFLSALLAGSLSFISTLLLARSIIPIYNRINKKHLNLSVLALLFILVLIVTGFAGLILFFTSIIIGILPLLLDVRKSSVLGCLVVPIIFFYLQ